MEADDNADNTGWSGAPFGIRCRWSLRRVAAATPGSDDGRALASAITRHSLIAFAPQDEAVTPSLMHDAYVATLHCLDLSLDEQHEPQKPRTPGPDGNLRGASFPGCPGETQVLGYHDCIDWHGLQGRMWPTPWHEEHNIEWHHDGGFAAGVPSPPPLVLMYTHTAARAGGSVLRWPIDNRDDDSGRRDYAACAEEELPYGPGATLFRSMRAPLRQCAPALAARARRMVGVYRRGFALFREGVYPFMRPSGVTSATAPADDIVGDAMNEGATYRPLFLDGTDASKPPARYALVQCDAAGEYCFVAPANLETLEEEVRACGGGPALCVCAWVRGCHEWRDERAPPWTMPSLHGPCLLSLAPSARELAS